MGIKTFISNLKKSEAIELLSLFEIEITGTEKLEDLKNILRNIHDEDFMAVVSQPDFNIGPVSKLSQKSPRNLDDESSEDEHHPEDYLSASPGVENLLDRFNFKSLPDAIDERERDPKPNSKQDRLDNPDLGELSDDDLQSEAAAFPPERQGDSRVRNLELPRHNLQNLPSLNLRDDSRLKIPSVLHRTLRRSQTETTLPKLDLNLGARSKTLKERFALRAEPSSNPILSQSQFPPKPAGFQLKPSMKNQGSGLKPSVSAARLPALNQSISAGQDINSQLLTLMIEESRARREEMEIMKLTIQGRLGQEEAENRKRILSFVKDCQISNLTFSNDANESINAFLERVIVKANQHDLSEKELLEVLPSLFKKSAEVYYKSRIKDNMSYDEVIQTLRTVFMPLEKEEALKLEIRSRRQKYEESYFEFSSYMCEQNVRLNEPFSEEELVKIIKPNLLPKYQASFAGRKIVSLTDLESICYEIEMYQSSMQRFKIERNQERSKNNFQTAPNTSQQESLNYVSPASEVYESERSNKPNWFKSKFKLRFKAYESSSREDHLN